MPEVLVVRMEVYRAVQKWDAMQTIARRLAKYDPNDAQWTVSWGGAEQIGNAWP